MAGNTTLASLRILVGADVSGVAGPMQQAQRQVAALGTTAARTQGNVGNLGGTVNKLGSQLLSLTGQMTGISPQLLRIGNLLSTFAIGGGVTGAVIAGVALMGMEWKKASDAVKEYGDALEATSKRLDDLIRKKAVGGQLGSFEDMIDARTRAGELGGQIAGKRAQLTSLSSTAVGREVFKGAIADLRAEIAELEPQLNSWRQKAEAARVAVQDGIPAIEGITVAVDSMAKRMADTADALARRLKAQAAALASVQFLFSSSAPGMMGRGSVPTQGALPMGDLGVRPNGGLNLTPTVPNRAGQGGGANDTTFGEKLKGLFSGLGDSIGGLLSALNPWQILLTAIEHALGDFLTSVTPIVDLLASALMPILKAWFPILKMVAIAATYIGQVFFTISGGILKAVGWLVKGLGALIEKLPGVGDFGLKKAGQAMIDLGAGFSEAAGELGKSRDEIRKLEWVEALDPLADAANKTAEALLNVPTGFKVALARFNATVGGPASGLAVSASGGGVREPVSFAGATFIVKTDSPEKFERWAQQQAARGGASVFTPAYAR